MGIKRQKSHLEASPIVHKLVRLLQVLPGYSINEIIKGGSLGKGTAISGSDIDLIVFFNRYKSIEHLMADKEKIIYDIFNYFNKFDYMSFVRYDEYLIQYKIMDINSNRPFHVDIVPAMRVVPDRYSKINLLSVYEEMESKPKDTRHHYSPCFARVQTGMVNSKPNKVQNLICMLKNWKQEFDVPIKSYCCEVISLFVHYTYFDEAQSFNVDAAFLEAMELLSDYTNLQIVLPFYYEIDRWKIHFPDKPYILDPVNPFSDTTDRSLDHYGKVEIENCAEQTFKKLKSIGGYQSLSTTLKDKIAIQWLQTTTERLVEEGGLAENREKSSSGCSIKCLLLIIGIIVLVVIVYFMFYRQW